MPFSITAISEADVEIRDITSIGEVGALAPNLQVTNTPGNSTAAQIAIRGGVTINPALDLDGTPLDVAHTQRHSDYESFSQEIQLLGGAGDLNYVAGVYVFRDDGFTDNTQRFFGAFGPFGQTFVSRYGFETDIVALFVQFDHALSEALTLTAGLRYTDESKEIERELGNAGIPAGTTAEYQL